MLNLKNKAVKKDTFLNYQLLEICFYVFDVTSSRFKEL